MRIAIPSATVMLVLAQACGANAILTSKPPPPGGGTLELLVSPPLNGAAAIRVTGPGGYNVSVTSTETLGATSALDSGLYTITAANVVVSGTTYVPVPASRTVLVYGAVVVATVYYCTSPCPWSAKAAMPTARNYVAVGVVNGSLYAVGGFSDGFATALNSVEAYDPSSDRWTAKSPMPTARGGLAVGVVNGILYAVGGSTGVFQATNVVEAYDPATDSWTSKAPMPTARYRFAMGEIDGVLYAVGGNGPGLQNVLEAYDPAADSWTVKAPLPSDEADLATGVVNGTLYAVGGGNPPYASATVYAYDPSTDSWATKTPLPTARYDLAVGVLKGKVYAVGGETSFSGVLNAFLTSNVVESYDPAMDTWVRTQSMPSWRSELAVGVVGARLYAIGGGMDPYSPSHAMEAYTP